MAKPLVLKYGDAELPFALEKVDRSDLYGFVVVETKDEKGRPCTLATLAEDGQTIVAPGGAAHTNLTPEGEWISRSDLKPVDLEGNPLTPAPSTFNAPPVELGKAATIDEFLNHDIRAVYHLTTGPDAQPLLDELARGTIYTFPFSYRGGLEPDTAFLLRGQDGGTFLLLGRPTRLEFIGFEQILVEEGVEAAGDEEDVDLDFGMM